MTAPIVFEKNKRIYADTRHIAQYLNRRHDNILRRCHALARMMPQHFLRQEAVNEKNTVCIVYHVTLHGFKQLSVYHRDKSFHEAYIHAYESYTVPVPVPVPASAAMAARKPNPLRRIVEDSYMAARDLAQRLHLCEDSERAYFNALLRREGINPPDPAMCEKMASASELAKRYNMTPKAFGAAVARLRGGHHGEYRLTHLPTGVQVPIFYWNEIGQTAIRHLLDVPVADVVYLQSA